MSKRPINDLLAVSLENVSALIDCSKIIGKPLILDKDKAVIPIAKVSFGFGAGGSEFDSKTNINRAKNDLLFESGEDLFPYGGGSMGGVSMQPEAFLIIEKEKTSLIRMEQDVTLFNKILDLVKDVIKK